MNRFELMSRDVGAAAVDVQAAQRDPRAAHHLDAVLMQDRRLGEAAHAAAADHQVVDAVARS